MTKDFTTYILKGSAITVITLFLAYLVLAIVSPAQLKVERSMKMFVQPKAVFAVMVCMDKWPKYDALQKFDPSVENNFSVENCGVGAWHEWNGEQAGHGKRKIVDLNPDEYIKLEVVLSQGEPPIEVEWFFNSDDQDGAEVICKYSGGKRSLLSRPSNLLLKYVIDELLVKSLTAIKREAEKNPGRAIPYYEYLVDVEEISMPSQTYLTEISRVNRDDFKEYQKKGPSSDLIKFAHQNGIDIPDSWVSLFLSEVDEKGNSGAALNMRTIATGIPIPNSITNTGQFDIVKIPAGKAYQSVSENAHFDLNKQFEDKAIRWFLSDNELKYVAPVRWIYEKRLDSDGTPQLSIRYVYQVTLEE